jgi:hypothetical protein
MSRAAAIASDRYYPISPGSGYASNTAGPESARITGTEAGLKRDASPTVRDSQPALLRAVWNAKARAAIHNWDDDGGQQVSEATATAAQQLVCALPEGLPPPSITPEATGEIAFEWYKDSRHIAVLTVQDGIIRWSGLMGTGAPVHGREFFTRTLPPQALIAIQATLD